MRLVIGCARSGTAYCAEGWGLGHERMNENGISSWLMGARHLEGFELPPDGVHGQVDGGWTPSEVVHVVRHPLKAIASQLVMRHGWLAWAQQYVDFGYPVAKVVPRGQFNFPVMAAGEEEHIRMLMRYWLGWNSLCARTTRRDVARVEELAFDEVEPGTNHRAHRALNWGDLYSPSDLYSDSHVLAERVWSRAVAYGYEEQPP